MTTFPPTLAVFWADLLRIKWLPLDIGNDDDDDEEDDDNNDDDNEGASRLVCEVDKTKGKLDCTGVNKDDGDDEFDVNDDNDDGDDDSFPE